MSSYLKLGGVVDSELKAANNYLTLMSKVKPLLNSYGSDVNYELLSKGLEMVKLFPHDHNMAPPPPNLTAYVSSEVAARLHTRNDALKYIGDMLERNKHIFAFCYGFYCGYTDYNDMMSDTATNDKLKYAYSLSKLKNQRLSSFILGLEAFKDYLAVMNNRSKATKN